MTDLFIFTKAPSAYEPVRYKEECDRLNISSEIVVYSDIDFIVTDKEINVLWKGKQMGLPKAAVFRAAGNDEFYIPQRDFLINWFEEHGVKVLNAATYKKWSRLDKITQHFELQKAGIPIVDSKIYGLNERLIEETTGYPKIIKKNLSSRGRDVYKVGSGDDVRAIFDQGYFARTMLLQPFLKIGQDLRIIVVGGKVIGAMKRIAQEGQYLTNFSQGGIVENYNIKGDPKALEIATKTAKHFDLDYVGVDLMMAEDGEWKVLEINRSCQFQGFEASTKINVPEKVIQFLGLIG